MSAKSHSLQRAQTNTTGQGGKGFTRFYRLLSKHPYLATLVVCVLLAPIYFCCTEASSDAMLCLAICIIVLAVLLACAFLLAAYKTQDAEKFACLLILAVGFAVKVIYAAGTSIYTRQNDVGDFTDEYTGHAGYIQYLMDYHQMPDFDPSEHWQFYHPPFHHIICAIWLTIWEDGFGITAAYAQESLQCLSLFYAMTIVITCYRILRFFKVQGWPMYISLSIISFHPSLIQFSGAINNDPLSVAFMMGAMLTTLQWTREPTLKNILKIALCVGLGMMTKLSAAAIAIPIALIFLYMLVKLWKTWKWKLIGHYAAFLAVCVPLGTWNSIRNLILFDLPLGYVQEMSLTSSQYTGDQSFWSRITDWEITTPFLQFTSKGAEENDVNPLLGALKSSLFGEVNLAYDMTNWLSILAFVLFWVNVVLALLGLIALVASMFLKDGRMNYMDKSFFLCFYLVMMITFYSLSISSPFVCSMNYRYITPTFMLCAMAIGICLQHLQEKTKARQRAMYKGSVAIVGGVTLVFVFLVLVFYINLIL